MSDEQNNPNLGAVELPDGSGCFTASMPLPKHHWIYGVRREVHPVLRGMNDIPEVRAAVREALQEAVKGATMCGREEDWDPDALVQNALYHLFGPVGNATPRHNG